MALIKLLKLIGFGTVGLMYVVAFVCVLCMIGERMGWIGQKPNIKTLLMIWRAGHFRRVSLRREE